MNSFDSWRALFENWPGSLPREGQVVSSFGEHIPFKDFLVSGGLVILERDKPDSYGARKVVLGYDAIAAVKFSSPMELARYQVMGFQAPF